MNKTVKSVPFFMHDLGNPEIEAIASVLTGPILTTGANVAQFEREFAQFLDSNYALGTTSCTGSLHMSLLALGIGPGDEVITTPMTFIATATAILEAGATPVFVDVESDTGNLNAELIERAITPRTKAILPVHLYGQMCDMRRIREIADKNGLYVIEDAAHCVEGERDGIKPGGLGDTACFSFYATKNLTCGEGGAVTANDAALFERLKLLRTHGMTKTAADRAVEGYQHWDMKTLGWKYNMDNIQGAMLIPQLHRLMNKWEQRDALAAYYYRKLKGLSMIEHPVLRANTRHAWHLFPIWVAPQLRDSVIQGLQERGVSVMVNYRAIHLLTFFKDTFNFREGDFPVAEKIGNSTISLPFYPGMPFEHVDYVVEALAQIFLPQHQVFDVASRSPSNLSL